jgi:formimidoylglutamate deiminase
MTILPELVWTNGRFERDRAIVLGDDGRITSVEPRAPHHHGTELRRRALLPGFVNAHSHAFQRGLRSQPQRFDTGSGNFWTWRETMYRLAESLDVQSFYDTSRMAFEEMLAAGITCVGEFHYLHHAGDRARWAFDDAIILAARDAGIRLVLLQCYYATGAIGKPLEGAQQRFGPGTREEFIHQLDRIASKLDASTQSIGLAPHSIRAVALDDLKFLADVAAKNHWPFHVHVEEQRKEIEQCVAAYGKNPLRLMLDELPIDARFTAIHCTHSKPEDLAQLAACGSSACLCPITEGNLADGLANVPSMRSARLRICTGSDSNIRIGMTEELRWLEFAQRLSREQRGVITDNAGRCATGLFTLGTLNGADALHINSGAIAPGRFADLITIDLDHPSMRGADDDAILDSLILGTGNGAIDQIWVNGQVRGMGCLSQAST